MLLVYNINLTQNQSIQLFQIHEVIISKGVTEWVKHNSHTSIFTSLIIVNIPLVESVTQGLLVRFTFYVYLQVITRAGFTCTYLRVILVSFHRQWC